MVIPEKDGVIETLPWGYETCLPKANSGTGNIWMTMIHTNCISLYSLRKKVHEQGGCINHLNQNVIESKSHWIEKSLFEQGALYTHLNQRGPFSPGMHLFF